MKSIRCGVPTLLAVFLISSASLADTPKGHSSSLMDKSAQLTEAAWDPTRGMTILANVPEAEPNDTCPGQPMSCGDMLVQATLTPGDIDYITFDAVKDDVLVIGTMSAGGLDPDTQITLYAANCNTVEAFDDDSGPGTFSLVTIIVPATKTYHVRIEGFSPSVEGDYIAFISCAPRVAGDLCANAIPLSEGSFSIAGTTDGALNDYTPGPEFNTCTGFEGLGGDVVYVINDPVFTLNVVYTSEIDGSIYLVENCSDPEGTCVTGSDETLVGEEEFLKFSSTSGGPYYLIVDNYFDGPPGPTGDYTLSGFLDVPPERWVDTGEGSNFGNGVGAAWGDYDKDGDLDLYLSNYDQNNNIYRNDGAGFFTDLPLPPINDVGNGRGVAWADYDNDGDLDLYLANAFTANKLFQNNGSGGFNDITGPPIDDTGDSRGVAWADFDNDGDVDLYLANAYSPNKLFHNNGVGGFTDVTSPPLDNSDLSTAVAWGDYDNDGDQDIYLVNYGQANKLFRNDGGGNFTDVASPALNDTGNGRGAAWADYDNDGDLDLYLTNAFTANKLFRNDGGGNFTDVPSIPLNDDGDGRGCAWGDFDNDGDLDLYLANALEANRLYDNDGAGNFADITGIPLGDINPSQGVALADYDGDGDLDIYSPTAGSGNKLYRNDLPAGNHWLHVELTGTISNWSAIGARVRVVAGGVSQIREISGGSGYMSQESLTAEFGLGSAVLVDTLEVTWPSGTVEDTTLVAADQVVIMLENYGPVTGIGDDRGRAPRSFLLRQNVPNPFNPATVIRYDVVKGGAAITLKIYDVDGELVRTLVNGYQAQGEQRAVWDGTNDAGHAVATGVYFYRMTAPGFVQTRKMVFLK